MSGPAPLDDAVLPGGVRSRFLDDVNGLRVHVLEAGQAANPCVLLLHGFPELAYSWRNVMPGLADAGFHPPISSVEVWPFAAGRKPIPFLRPAKRAACLLVSRGGSVVRCIA
jgi:pimeloyl-ACP methyl ester carboxylesterase